MEYTTSSLLKLTKAYWADYLYFLLGGITFVSIFGSLSIVATVFTLPNGLSYVLLAILGLVTHIAAFLLRDFWTDSFDIDENKQSTKESFAMYLTIGVYVSILLFASAAGATYISIYVNSSLLPILFAIYAPPLDFYLLRRKSWSPAGMTIRVANRYLEYVGVVFDVRNVPGFRQGKRPHFPR